MGSPQKPHTPLPLVNGTGTPSVPVFDCHVFVSSVDDGTVVARCVNLPEVSGRGATERDALRQVVAEFKSAVQRYREAGEDIPWSADEERPTDGEQERWIPVHL